MLSYFKVRMIFRRLYRRKLLRLFGPFMDASGILAIERIASELSEWQAFKALVPAEWLHSQEDIAVARQEVARLAKHYARDPESGPQ